MNWETAITDLVDVAVLLPLSLILAALMWGFQSRRAAFWLFGSLAICACITAILKLAFDTCSAAWGIVSISPSGHASMSAMVYGALAIVVARHRPVWQRPILLACSWMLVVIVAISRILVGAHSSTEVILGLLIGAGALALFTVQYMRRPVPHINLLLVFVLTAVAVVLMHGIHLQVETWLRQAWPVEDRWSSICEWTLPGRIQHNGL